MGVEDDIRYYLLFLPFADKNKPYFPYLIKADATGDRIVRLSIKFFCIGYLLTMVLVSAIAVIDCYIKYGRFDVDKIYKPYMWM